MNSVTQPVSLAFLSARNCLLLRNNDHLQPITPPEEVDSSMALFLLRMVCKKEMLYPRCNSNSSYYVQLKGPRRPEGIGIEWDTASVLR
jgi:hypothetical protein